VHLPDPLRGSSLDALLAAALAPRFRVLSIRLRVDRGYQVHVDDVQDVLNQFGFQHSVLAAEGLSCASALVLAAWYPHRVGSLALIDRDIGSPAGDSLTARSLRECPPVWDALRKGLHCPVVEFAGESPTLPSEIERLLTSGLP
jgi:pimeloyl-ACP methyl ester carboxylesterase